jgi:Peptidase family M23
VRAAGDGVVVFAGRVGAGLHVVVRNAGDIRATDSFLATIAVVAGQTVGRGAILGTSGGTGPGHGAAVLHFGVRVGSTPIDPMLLFAPPDLSAVVHLAAPRGGAAASAPADPSPPGATGERAALAAEVRVDARPRGAPPAWWHDQPETRPRAPAAGAQPRRPTSAPVHGGGPVTAPLVAAGGVLVVGLRRGAASPCPSTAVTDRRRPGSARRAPTTLRPGQVRPGLGRAARRLRRALDRKHTNDTRP